MQAEDGKTELSLIHFTKTNPKWRPPQEAEIFVNAIKEQTKDPTNILTVETINAAVVPTAALYGENSLSSIGVGVRICHKGCNICYCCCVMLLKYSGTILDSRSYLI